MVGPQLPQRAFAIVRETRGTTSAKNIVKYCIQNADFRSAIEVSRSKTPQHPSNTPLPLLLPALCLPSPMSMRIKTIVDAEGPLTTVMLITLETSVVSLGTSVNPTEAASDIDA